MHRLNLTKKEAVEKRANTPNKETITAIEDKKTFELKNIKDMWDLK